jgi:hypothetical protein
MGNILNKNTLQYIRSANEAEYNADEWLFNPDLSAVANVDKRFWKVDNNQVVEMSEGEKLPLLKKDKMGELLKWWNNEISNGISVDNGTYTLASTIYDQNRWTSLIGQIQLAVATGVKSIETDPNDETKDKMEFPDIIGVWHTITISKFFEYMLEFGAKCLTLSQTYSIYVQQINDASSIEELNNIVFN